MEETNVFLGTQLKLNLSIEPIGTLTMDDFDFSVELYCSAKRVFTVSKDKTLRVDENNYLILVDSEVLGQGELKCKVIAYVPDEDFDDSIRTEVLMFDTGIRITKNLT
jgi:hypothetical protein